MALGHKAARSIAVAAGSAGLVATVLSLVGSDGPSGRWRLLATGVCTVGVVIADRGAESLGRNAPSSARGLLVCLSLGLSLFVGPKVRPLIRRLEALRRCVRWSVTMLPERDGGPDRSIYTMTSLSALPVFNSFLASELWG
jgi:hypothetical protein